MIGLKDRQIGVRSIFKDRLILFIYDSRVISNRLYITSQNSQNLNVKFKIRYSLSLSLSLSLSHVIHDSLSISCHSRVIWSWQCANENFASILTGRCWCINQSPESTGEIHFFPNSRPRNGPFTDYNCSIVNCSFFPGKPVDWNSVKTIFHCWPALFLVFNITLLS